MNAYQESPFKVKPGRVRKADVRTSQETCYEDALLFLLSIRISISRHTAVDITRPFEKIKFYVGLYRKAVGTTFDQIRKKVCQQSA
jgi:hypothetical protein